MLNDDTGRLVELFHALQRRVSVGDVVIGERFALDLGSRRHGGLFNTFFYIEGSLLVAVFAVTHILLLNKVQVKGTWEAASGLFSVTVVRRNQAAKVVGDHAVIGGGVLEGFNREVETSLKGQRAFVSIHLFNNGVVVTALYHNRHVFMVLGSGAHHGRATDIDILYGVFQRASFTGNGRGKGIKVHYHHIDRIDAMLSHDPIILTATAKNAAVDFRVQRLYTSIHHFREAGVIGHFGYRQAFICQQAGSTAGGEQLHAALGECLSEFDDTGLIRNTEQSAADWTLLHGINPRDLNITESVS